ncbi:hypothetical protein [Haloterrigena alkaliphila]|uniref:hypothetical protein n=1 Tax=Haloterrigena alkaliphila TaxID=2816475 RepID=UPI001CFFE3D4|nr:hypothetical protein [Haloterrigena alkaliphila]UHQ95301.1 hypothetical protein J0X25_20755 [Haloterrigena alkaliphila]
MSVERAPTAAGCAVSITFHDSHEILKVCYVNPSVDAVRSASFRRDGPDEYPTGGSLRSIAGGRTNVIPDAPIDGLYAGSNGRYYTNSQVTRKLRTGRWKPCIRQRDPDRRLVETTDETLLLLRAADDLPAWAEVRIDDGRARVVDTRRPLPGDSASE